MLRGRQTQQLNDFKEMCEMLCQMRSKAFSNGHVKQCQMVSQMVSKTLAQIDCFEKNGRNAKMHDAKCYVKWVVSDQAVCKMLCQMGGE